MDDNEIRRAVTSIKMPADMKTRIADNCRASSDRNTSSPTRSGHVRRAIRTAAALAAAFVLCFTLALPALAANVPAVYDGLYAIAPATAQYFKPIQLSCEDNGIRMEVISAYIHDDTAEIYIAVQDMTGERLDSTIDLFDSYNINTAFDSTGHCTQVSFDPQTQTAVFLINIQHMDNEPITRSKLTFSIGQMLTGKQNISTPITCIDLTAANRSPETAISNGYKHLAPGNVLFSPADGAALTAYGIVDGKLHVQVRYDDVRRTDNHGWLYLNAADDGTVRTIDAIIFDAANSRYYEYVFDISGIELSEYTLHGDFTLCDTLIKGSWEVTFPLEDAVTD